MDNVQELIEPLNAMLTDNFGPFGPLIVAGGCSVCLMILLTLPMLLKKQQDPLDQLREMPRRRGTNADRQGKDACAIDSKKDKLEKYSTFLEPQDEAQYSAIRLKLLQAGYRARTRSAPITSRSSRWASACWSSASLYAILQIRDGSDPIPTKMLLCRSSARASPATCCRNTGSPSASRSARRRSPTAFPTRWT